LEFQGKFRVYHFVGLLSPFPGFESFSAWNWIGFWFIVIYEFVDCRICQEGDEYLDGWYRKMCVDLQFFEMWWTFARYCKKYCLVNKIKGKSIIIYLFNFICWNNNKQRKVSFRYFPIDLVNKVINYI
jgi:hypothetical protein